jgi:hypothetical protein
METTLVFIVGMATGIGLFVAGMIWRDLLK